MERTAVLLRRLVLVTVALLAAVGTVPVAALAAPSGPPPSSAPTAGDDGAPTAPQVEAEVATGEAEVIAVTRAPGEQVVADVVGDAPAGSVSDVDAGAAPVVAATVDAEGLEALRSSPAVERILPNRTHRVAADPWVDSVGVPAADSLGWDGTGQTIAVLDSGVQADHPYLAGKVVAEACFSRSSVAGAVSSLCAGGSERIYDSAGAASPCSGITGCDHGTHVAGIAVGGPLSSPRPLQGVAPEASLVAVKVFTRGTTTTACNGPAPCLLAYDSDLIAALDWLSQRRAAGDPRFTSLAAVNLSLGGGLYAAACDALEPTAPYITALRAAGVLTVAATGNNYANGQASSAGMASPACVSSVVSVGATTPSGTLASYSNLSGATTLLAPGGGIDSSVPTNGWLARTGTSMATPMVAGAIAVLRERDPSASVEQVVARLRASGDQVATPLGTTPALRVDRAVGVLSPNLPPGSPFGFLDSATAGLGSVSVSGWAIDPDTLAPVDVVVSVDGRTTPARADRVRDDVGSAYPAYGAVHGYEATVVASAGPHRVCVTAVDVGVGSDTTIGCRTVTVPGGSPFGVLDAVRPAPGSVSVQGWAIDPDGAAPIAVHVYVDGQGYPLVAGVARPDVGGAFPLYGPGHGFEASLPAAPGPHQVCAYGIDQGGSSNTLLGCRVVTVPSASPIGFVDSVDRGPGRSATAAGWTIDPDRVTPIRARVIVVVPGVGFLSDQTVPADQVRTDVGAAFPSYGSAHGWSLVLADVPPGAYVCAIGVNEGFGQDALLGCTPAP